MRVVAAALLLVGCDAEVPTAARLADKEPMPPQAFDLDLEVDGALVRGGTMTFTVTGLAPGQRVFVVGSPVRAPGGTCPPWLGGRCVELERPRHLGTASADATGTARLARTVPSLAEDRWWFQAAAARPSPGVSDVVGRYVKRHGAFFPVVFQSLIATQDTIEGSLMEAGAWADTRNYVDHPWACYLRTPLTAAPVETTVPCPGCEYTWRVELDQPFEELELDAECQSYFGHDAAFFDALFAPSASGGTERDGGWAGYAGGSEWGIDLDWYDSSAGTVYPVSMMFQPVTGTWWVLGPIARVRHPDHDEFVIGLGYSGSFTY
jgi:hypothetical protein